MLPSIQIGGVADGIISARRGENRSQQGRFIERQLFRRFTEMVTCRRFRPEHALPPLSDIEV